MRFWLLLTISPCCALLFVVLYAVPCDCSMVTCPQCHEALRSALQAFITTKWNRNCPGAPAGVHGYVQLNKQLLVQVSASVHVALR